MTLSGTATASDGGMMPGQSPVLRIIVENLYYPVSLEVLHQVKLHYTEMLWFFHDACHWSPIGLEIDTDSLILIQKPLITFLFDTNFHFDIWECFYYNISMIFQLHLHLID